MANPNSLEFDVSKVAENAPDSLKLQLGNMMTSFLNDSRRRNQDSFGKAIQLRMKFTELSIISKAEELPNGLEGRVVLEIDVAEDMVNGGGNIYGGCSAFLIDVSSSFALIALNIYQTGLPHRSVSQSLNVVYHSPATIGDRIRLVNTTLTVDSQVQSVRTEIWNVTHHRLVASGVHVKMLPSQSPKAAL